MQDVCSLLENYPKCRIQSLILPMDERHYTLLDDIFKQRPTMYRFNEVINASCSSMKKFIKTDYGRDQSKCVPVFL